MSYLNNLVLVDNKGFSGVFEVIYAVKVKVKARPTLVGSKIFDDNWQYNYNLIISNGTETFEATIKKADSNFKIENKYVEVVGYVDEWKGEFSCILNELITARFITDDDRAQFSPSPQYHILDMDMSMIRELFVYIKNRTLREFTQNLFDRQFNLFKEIEDENDERCYFYAKVISHIAKVTSTAYKRAKDSNLFSLDGNIVNDTDLVLCGCLLSDIGRLYDDFFKVKSSEYNKMTENGSIVNFIEISSNVFEEEFSKIRSKISWENKINLFNVGHIIKSHLSEKTNNNLENPNTTEADIVSEAYKDNDPFNCILEKQEDFGNSIPLIQSKVLLLHLMSNKHKE